MNAREASVLSSPSPLLQGVCQSHGKLPATCWKWYNGDLSIRIVPYTPEHIEAVRQFNLRIGSVAEYREFQFPEAPPECRESEYLRRKAFVAVEDGAVRGGYLLLMREFFLGGRVRTVAHCRLPVSEGLIDRAYSSVGMRLLRSAVQQQPLVFALGMGGMHNPLPRLLDALGWRLWPVPFYFKAIRPTRCLRQIQALRASTIRRVLTDTAAATGLGWIGLKTVQTLRSRAHGAVRCETVTEFGAWADEIWEDCAKQYAMIATRDSRTLNQMYPASSARFIRLRAKDGGRMSGWVVVLDTQMYGDRHFGNLRVGTIADCLAPPEFVSTSILAATRALQERGVDLIISNQMHVDWGAALRRAGFLRGPSNFIFAASKQLAEALSPFEAACRRSHMNRGDGDGPVNL